MADPVHAEHVTQLLNLARRGDTDAAERLYPLVHQELHGLASRLMRSERPGHTLSPTALVNEAWLRLGGAPAASGTELEARGQFFLQASKAMRHVLVDHARARKALKRGGDQERVPLESVEAQMESRAETYLAVDEALVKLASADDRAAKLAELHLFGGLGHAESARALGVSLRSAERGWRFARAFLQRELGGDPELDG